MQENSLIYGGLHYSVVDYTIVNTLFLTQEVKIESFV